MPGYRLTRLAGIVLVVAVIVSACAPTPTATTAPSVARGPGAEASASEPAAPPPRLSVQLAYTALVASQSVSWIAQESGIFDRHGLDVNMSFINGGPAGVAALVSGEVDVLIVGAASIVRAALQGSDAVLIAGTKNQLLGAIMGRPEIRTPAELRGRRVGVASRGSNSELVVRVGLQRNGIDPDDGITYLAVGSGNQRLAAMQQGAIDACGCIPPDNIAAEEAGFRVIVDVSKMNYRYPATQVATTRRKIQEQPELLRRFLAAFAEGVHRYKTDPEFAMKVIAKYSQVDDPRALQVGYEAEREIMEPDLRLDLEAIRATLEELAPIMPQALQANPEEFIDTRFVRELEASGYFQRLWR
ncbi:MAG TPA: ABC transporter substrate-binding protein [Chloroflexota bacterium]|nr:ABC transporter substrate-binding protein [Chloroflexota bacterium]